MIKYLLPAMLCFISSAVNASSFTTEANSLRNISVGEIDNHSVYFLSELDGSVSAYKANGTKLWRQSTTSPAVMFDIEAVDLNNDNNDDVIAASGDGHIYAWNSEGKLLWTFTPGHKVRFSEVAVINNNNNLQIFAGGNDYQLYELNSQGKLISSTPIEGVVRTIESGNFLGNGKQSLFLMTYYYDKFRWQFMGLLDPANKKVIKSVNHKDAAFKPFSSFMLTDVTINDIDDNGKDDILFFGDIKFKAAYFSLNEKLALNGSFIGSKKDNQRYAHSQGVYSAQRDEVIFKHSSVLYTLNNQGKLMKKVGKKYNNIVYNDLAIDEKNNTLIAAGVVGGGNSIYRFSLNKKNWWDDNDTVKGRMATVEKNINHLYQQALDFKLPSYQQKSDQPWVMISNPANNDVMALNGADMAFIKQYTWSENTSRDDLVAIMGKIALKKDKRKKYDLSQKQIIAKAKEMEKNNKPFALWAGHVTDPFYLRIDTLEKILEVAPTTCYGFVYAEMHDPKDPRVIHFINEYVPRLATAIRKNNRAKLYFRYKNVFWGITSHVEPWKEMFHSGKYADILVPASEDTSSRTQDINLAGRVGMLAGGAIDDFAMRLIDDNPTSWRPLSPGGQKSASPFLRQGALMAAYGAKFGINQSSGFLDGTAGHNILYALMKSGALPMVEPKDILSISSWHLLNGVDEKLIHSIDDHHNMLQYRSDDDNAVFSVAQMHWAGASLPDYDYSKAALGVDYRWLNYLPIMPSGMVPIGSASYKNTLTKQNIPYTISDAKYGYLDGNSNKIPANAFGKYITQAASSGAKKMPVVVKGASWATIRIDENHIRVIMADPGYIDPQDRNVNIRFNGKTPKAALDILSKKPIKISNKTVTLTVPAGSMRFVDLTY